MGTALIGSLFVGRLADDLAANLSPQATAHLSASGAQVGDLTPGQLAQLPAPIAHGIVTSYAQALIPLHLYLVPLLLVGLAVAFLQPEKPLTTTVRGRGPSTEPRPGNHRGAHVDPGARLSADAQHSRRRPMRGRARRPEARIAVRRPPQARTGRPPAASPWKRR